MGVRPEIQALRALAVSLVVGNHLYPRALPGGYIGVDVFFVVSGFLITGLLLREIERTGTLSLTAFWARRVRRILPAAFVTLTACGVGLVAFVPLSLRPQFVGELRASLLYAQNWRLAADAVDYFAVAGNRPSPVQHFWSLAVEEQFYLAWPVLLVLAARARRRTLVAAMAALTVLSLAYSLHETAANPALAYFVTPARAWEFGAGALLAAARSPARPSRLLCWTGLVTIAAGAFAFSASTPFPGAAALVPVLGTLAVIRAGAAARVLALPPIQFLGDVSYSVYLWHWPLLIFAPFVFAGELDREGRLALLALTLLLAWLSKRLVEDPARASARLARPAVAFGGAGVVTLALLALTSGVNSQVRRQVETAKRTTRAVVAAHPACFGAAARDPERPCSNPRLRLSVVPTPVEARDRRNAPCTVIDRLGAVRVCAFGARDRHTATVALIGDSHAGHWRAALAVVARAKGWRGLSITHTSCSLSTARPGLREPDRTNCKRWRTQVFEWMRRHPDVRTVFISGSSLGAFDVAMRGYIGAWRRLPASVERIIVIRDTPRMPADRALCVEEAMLHGRAAGPSCRVPRSIALPPDPQIVAAARSPRARSVDLTRFFCDARTCYPVVGGVLVYKDNNHITTVFAETLGPYLQRAVDAL